MSYYATPIWADLMSGFDDLFAAAALSEAVEAAANASDAFEATEAALEVGNKLSLAKPLVKPLLEPIIDQLGS